MPVILVVGDVMTDIIVRPAGPIAPGGDVRAAIRTHAGGSAANLACWLAGEGIGVRLAARAGREDHARLMAEFAAIGVDARLGLDPLLPSGALVTLLDASGERSFLTDRGANDALAEADLPDALLDGADLLHVSAYALFNAPPRAAVLRLAAAARMRGVRVSIDTASHSWLADAGPSFFDWTEGAALIVANSEEAAVLTGESDWKRQCAALAERYPLAVVKGGAEGALAASRDGKWWHQQAMPAEVMDTSGAGDAFLAGFLAEWLARDDVGGGLHRGAALGAKAVSLLGARPPRTEPGVS